MEIRKVVFTAMMLSMGLVLFASTVLGSPNVEDHSDKNGRFIHGCIVGLEKLGDKKLKIADNKIWCGKLAQQAKASRVWNEVPLENFSHFGCFGGVVYASGDISADAKLRLVDKLCQGV